MASGAVVRQRLIGTLATVVVVAIVFPWLLSSSGLAANAGKKHRAARATRDFRHLLHQRYGTFRGYIICPAGQMFGTEVDCQAEFRQGTTWYRAYAIGNVGTDPTSFSHFFSDSWKRRWSSYSAASIRGFHTPGVASVNTPYYDWAFLAANAYQLWKKHRQSAVVDAFDGNVTGFRHFENFHCTFRPRRVFCTNAFGDAMRYRPTG